MFFHFFSFKQDSEAYAHAHAHAHTHTHTKRDWEGTNCSRSPIILLRGCNGSYKKSAHLCLHADHQRVHQNLCRPATLCVRLLFIFLVLLLLTKRSGLRMGVDRSLSQILCFRIRSWQNRRNPFWFPIRGLPRGIIPEENPERINILHPQILAKTILEELRRRRWRG